MSAPRPTNEINYAHSNNLHRASAMSFYKDVAHDDQCELAANVESGPGSWCQCANRAEWLTFGPETRAASARLEDYTNLLNAEAARDGWERGASDDWRDETYCRLNHEFMSIEYHERTGRDMDADYRIPQRIQRKRLKGWRLPEGAICVSRARKDNPGAYGNPFTIEQYGRAQSVALHRAWLLAQPELVAKVRAKLRSKDLACWCKLDELCHADTLIAVANGRVPW